MARMTKKTEQQVREFLADLSKPALIDAVMERAADDAEYRRRLVLDAARSSGEVDPAVFRRAIADALKSGSASRRDYARTSANWVRGVDAAIDPVEELLSAGNPDMVVNITEYALSRIDTIMSRVDDSSGWFSQLIIRLEQLHHTACLAADPHPIKLARRLFKLDVDGDWDIFIDCAKDYADVLGEPGLAELQRLGDARWADLPPASPWGERDRTAGAFHLTRMMSNLAELADDVNARVEVMARELNHPYRFLEIAEVLADAGRKDEAIEWAERGLDGPVDLPPHMRSDKRLDDFVLARYQERDRVEDLTGLVWRRFTDRAELPTFARLKVWTEAVNEWSSYRSRALKVLRTDAGRRGQTPRPAASRASQRWGGAAPKPAFEDLIAVLIFEAELDEAWQLADEHGCSRSVWNDLAAASESARPLDAARVYEREINELIDRKQTQTYEEAVSRISQLRILYERAERSELFHAFLDGTRKRHKPKVKFMRMLNDVLPDP